MMNVIETRQGDGTYVTSLEPALLVEHLDFVLSLDHSAIHHLFEVRRIVEVGIAELAAERITEAQLQELELLLEKASETIDESETFLRVDLQMHDLIAEAAGNPLLTRVMSSLSGLGQASRKRTGAMLGIRRQALVDHQSVMAALRRATLMPAAEAMKQHLGHVELSIG